jgi:hypothetical protein
MTTAVTSHVLTRPDNLNSKTKSKGKVRKQKIAKTTKGKKAAKWMHSASAATVSAAAAGPPSATLTHVDGKKAGGNLYEFTTKTIDQERLGVQEKIVYQALQKTAPADIATIAEACVGLQTKQKPSSVVSHYIGRWKKDGFVRLSK